MKTRITYQYEKERQAWAVRVNGQLIIELTNEYMARSYAKAICQALEIAGVDYEGKPL